MPSLDQLLAQVRRIEQHRLKRSEKQIQKAYQNVLKDLRHYLADEYTAYAENDQLTYDILQRHGRYGRFLEEVEQKINTISPEVKRLIRSTVDQTYEATYNGMIDCVRRNASGVGLRAVTADVIRRAVENPISKLTLNDRLEKHRREIIYDIKQNISVGLLNGDRYSTMANRIKQSVDGDYKKAIRIVRTETHRVREAGNHDAATAVNQELKEGSSGMRMHKIWKTMKDERVRPAGKAKGKARKYDHRKMDGVSIYVDEEFDLPSGAKTVAPGQSGVAGEDINCRCYLSYSLQKVEAVDESELQGSEDNDIIELGEQQFDVESNTTKLKSAMSDADYQEYLEHLNQHPNQQIRKLYATHADNIADIKQTSGGAYSPARNSITFSYPNDQYIQNGKNKYSVLAHEYGHFFDAKVSYDNLHFKEIEMIKSHVPYSYGVFKPVASSSDEFLEAVRKDKQYLKTILTDDVKSSLRKSDASDGVQDAIDGLLGQRIGWGHGDKYYNRKYSGLKQFKEQKQLQEAYKELGFDVSNQSKVSKICRDYESSSEIWANVISAETLNDESLEYVKKYLPNSYDAMRNILKGVK